MRCLSLALAACSLAAGTAAANPTSVDAFETAALLSGDCRMVVLGDSFASSTYRRVPVAMLNFWRQSSLTALTAPAGNLGLLAFGSPMAAPFKELNAEGTNDYRALEFTGSPVDVTLPIRNTIEFVGDPEFVPGENGELIRFTINNARHKLAPYSRITNVGSRVRFRGLFWSPPNPALMHSPIALSVQDETLASFNPRIQSRARWHEGDNPAGPAVPPAPGEINAFPTDLEFVLQQGNANADVSVLAAQGTLVDGRTFHSAGGVYARLNPLTGERVPGLYYSALSDSSWSYSGFGSDTAPEFELDKTFTQDQFTGWLDATTLDPEQPVVFTYMLAAEPDQNATASQRIEAMIDQAQASADEIGLTTVRHLLVVPHMHDIKGLPSEFVVRFRFDIQRDAMFEIAERRPEVSVVSIYDATDKVLFFGSEEARQWLRDNAPNPFQYTFNSIDLADGPRQGRLLDNFVLHPEGEDGAAYFASVLYEELFRPLQLDLNGDRILDQGDIQLFVGFFLLGNMTADFNGDGILDTGDITTFIERYLDAV